MPGQDVKERFYPGEDGSKVTRFFFSNITAWGPKALRFLDEYRGERFHMVGLAETHLLPARFRALAGNFANLGRRPYAAHSRPSGKSEGGSSGGVVLLPNMALSLNEIGNDPASDWTRKGDDWHLVIVRAKHCSYIVAIAYMDHTIGARGINIQKLKQLQKAILYYKLPYIIFADWNMDPSTLRESGFTDQINGEIKVAPGVTETCISGNILDYLVVSRSFASAIELYIASPRSPWRAHKGFEVDITRSPRAIHILAILKPKAFDLENLVDLERRPDWADCEDESDEADVRVEDNEEVSLGADKFAILLEPILSKEILNPALQLGRSYRSLSRQSEKYLSLSTTGRPGMGGSGSRGDFPKFKRQPLEHWSQANVTGKHTVEARVWCNAENRVIEMIRAKKM